MIEIATDRELTVQAALAEFTALRSESIQNQSMQWNIVAFQLTATAVLFSFSLTNHSRTGFLLIVPLVSYVLSARYLKSYWAFLQIGKYIREDLSKRVPDGALYWETWWKDNEIPKSGFVRTLVSFGSGPATFPIIAGVALAWTFPYIHSPHNFSETTRWILGIVWLLDLTATAISAYTMSVGLPKKVGDSNVA